MGLVLLLCPMSVHGQQRVGFVPQSSIVPQFAAPPAFGIETGITCPTLTVNISGFGANANNWAAYPDTQGGHTGFGNYGVLGGINLPFGGSLSRFCAEFAAQKALIQKLNREAQELNNANFIITSCTGFTARKVSVNSDAFIKAFPMYAKCKDISYTSQPPAEFAPGAPSKPPTTDSPAKATTTDFPKATPVIIVP